MSEPVPDTPSARERLPLERLREAWNAFKKEPFMLSMHNGYEVDAAIEALLTAPEPSGAERELLEEIASLADHPIPYYLYGDNEAARDFAIRLEKIAALATCSPGGAG